MPSIDMVSIFCPFCLIHYIGLTLCWLPAQFFCDDAKQQLNSSTNKNIRIRWLLCFVKQLRSKTFQIKFIDLRKDHILDVDSVEQNWPIRVILRTDKNSERFKNTINCNLE